MGSSNPHEGGWDTVALLKEARERKARDPSLRVGQCVYNVAYSYNPAVARLAATDVDPYYSDAHIAAFLDALSAEESPDAR